MTIKFIILFSRIIDEKDIDPTTKCKKDEQGLTQQEIFKICQEQH